MAEGIFKHSDYPHRIPESDNSQNFWTDDDMNRKDPITFFSPGSWARMTEEFLSDEERHRITDSVNSESESDEELALATGEGLTGQGELKTKELLLLNRVDRTTEEFHSSYEDQHRIPDSDNSESETDDEELSLTSGHGGQNSKEPLLTKRGNPVNLDKKGGVLWKREFCKDKVNLQLLDPNVKRKTQLNKMWSELDDTKKLKWINEAEVELRKKQKDLETKKEFSFPSFQRNGPLLKKNGRTVNLNIKGRLLWKTNFRADKKKMELLLPNIKSKKQLNKMWIELDESEKLEWRKKAEIKLRNRQEMSKLTFLPPIHNNSEMFKHEIISQDFDLETEEEILFVSDSSLPREGLLENHEPLLSLDDEEPEEFLTLDEDRDRTPDLDHYPKEIDEEKLPLVTNRGEFLWNEPLLTKKGNPVNLNQKGKVLWKKEFRKDRRKMQLLDPNIKQKTQLNQMWNDLPHGEKLEWMDKVEVKLRMKQENSRNEIFLTATSTPTVFVRGDEERNQARLGYMTRRGKDKSSVTIDLPKPQDQFLFKVDNSIEPFVPALTKKPNSLPLGETVPYDPIALGPIVGEDGVEFYAHPYEEEIRAWTPTEHQLSFPSQVEPISELAFGEPFNIIDTIEGVHDLLCQLKSSTEFAVDLEHHSVRSFMGLTCLIQISTRTQDFIVDGLALHQQLDVLNEVFTDPKIVKVFHGASNDILWLQQDFGLYIVGLFDTSVAGKYLFNGKLVSLKYLLENLVGIEVDKSHQISEWRIRPLPPDMIHYARSDTHYLLSLFDIMKEMLSQDGTEQVKAVYEDSKAICLQIFRKPRSTPSPSFLEKVGKLSSRSTFAFLELFKWRDTLGRELDESGPLFILSNKLLEKLARSLPTNPNYFREIMESHCNDVISPLIQAHMDTLIHIMEMALEIPLSDSDAEDDECGGGEDFESDDESQTQDEDMLKSINFRRMAIIPSLEELFSDEQNLLEKNVISGPYRNLNHYLNVQFKLLREDFIRSIKPGLKDYKERKSIRTYPGIKVHTNIQFLGLGKNEKPNQWRLQLPPKLNQLTKSSKRFLPGSFLLFTTDHFMNTHSGLISHPRDLQALLDEDNGIFTVSIRAGELPTEPWVIGQRFVTIECDAYFEPYRNVMQVLKHNTWLDKNPIGKYLLNGSVSGQGQVRLPHYLTGEQRITVESIEVDLKNPETWPSPHELGLDDAQFRAYQAALTQEIVLIQGPPGTGKTYLGLKILQTLMEEENEDLWRGKNGMDGPIIVVCFTNHALDQFGEGILDMYTPEDEPKSFRVENPRILRLGMNCSSERLSGYTTDGYDNLKVKARMQDMDIILCTTTGAAMRHSVLTKLNSKILIVEEAAEVMESHIIGCLTRSIQHLILLGDHQQLRPLTASHELSHMYHLDVSLFERLTTKNNFPKFTLEIQRRMRPEIRDLITGPHIYPILKDHESVTQYPPIKGVKTSMFFLHHCYLETDTDNDSIENQSKSNPFEAQFLACLAVYLLRQGYQEENITVLAMYSSQVRLLATEIWHRRGISRKLRIETVDSFQGEENTIVLLSLVRSNQRNSIGFMRTDNRICVALSRAKHGFYIVGNMNLLARNSSTWATINEKLLRSGLIGTTLTLTCDQHDDMSVQVGTVQQFEHILMTPCPACLNNKNSGKAGARAGRKTKWV